MNSDELHSLLQNPLIINSEHLLQVEEIIKEYPYFQLAHFLKCSYLKQNSLVDYQNILPKIALYASNRSVLYIFLHKTIQTSSEPISTIIQEEIKVESTEKTNVEVQAENIVTINNNIESATIEPENKIIAEPIEQEQIVLEPKIVEDVISIPQLDSASEHTNIDEINNNSIIPEPQIQEALEPKIIEETISETHTITLVDANDTLKEEETAIEEVANIPIQLNSSSEQTNIVAEEITSNTPPQVEETFVQEIVEAIITETIVETQIDIPIENEKSNESIVASQDSIKSTIESAQEKDSESLADIILKRINEIKQKEALEKAQTNIIQENTIESTPPDDSITTNLQKDTVTQNQEPVAEISTNVESINTALSSPISVGENKKAVEKIEKEEEEEITTEIVSEIKTIELNSNQNTTSNDDLLNFAFDISKDSSKTDKIELLDFSVENKKPIENEAKRPKYTSDYYELPSLDESSLDITNPIDAFLVKKPKMRNILQESFHLTENQTDISKHSVQEGDYLSETLARIYLQQKNFSKAKQIYEKLSLKFPQKSVYFANQISEIEKNLK